MAPDNDFAKGASGPSDPYAAMRGPNPAYLGGATATASAGNAEAVNTTPLTSTVACTAGTEGTPILIVSSGALTYDGSSEYTIEFFAPYASCAVGSALAISLWDNTTDLGRWAFSLTDGMVINLSRVFAPTAGTHTYKVMGWRSAGGGIVGPAAGAGGVATNLPGFIRITKTS